MNQNLLGKGKKTKKGLPSDKKLKEVFGVVNEGCDSKQIIEFVKRTTVTKERSRKNEKIR